MNGGNYWIELQALGDDGTNYALNKTVTGNTETPAEGNYSILVDGKTGEWDTYLNPGGGDAWLQPVRTGAARRILHLLLQAETGESEGGRQSVLRGCVGNRGFDRRRNGSSLPAMERHRIARP